MESITELLKADVAWCFIQDIDCASRTVLLVHLHHTTAGNLWLMWFTTTLLNAHMQTGFF